MANTKLLWIVLTLLMAGLLFGGRWFADVRLGRDLPADFRILRPSYAIDLESKQVEQSLEATRDLWWEAYTETERCLCPAFRSTALLARIPDGEYEDIDAEGLSELEYSAEGFKHSNQGGEVRAGLALAVRTVEGNFAKVRVLRVDGLNQLYVESETFLPDGAEPQAKPPSVSLQVNELETRARAALKERRRKDAAADLDQMVALAQTLPEGDMLRIRTLATAGRLYWSARTGPVPQGTQDPSQQALMAAVIDIMQRDRNFPNGTAGSDVPPLLAADVYRFVGINHRDAGRHEESIQWFQDAADRASLAPETNHNLKSLKYLTITGDLEELAIAQCRVGNRAAAGEASRRLKEACGHLSNPASVAACNGQPEC